MSPIPQDGAIQDNGDADDFDVMDAADAFGKLGDTDAEKPSATDDDEDEQEAAPEKEVKTDDGAEGDDESSEETPEDDGDADGDEDEVDGDEKVVIKHTVDGEEREFTLGQLKRLAGQEASLTRKSQEVAESRKRVDSQATAHVSMLAQALKRAEDRYKQFEGVDIASALKDPNVSVEEIKAFQSAEATARADVEYFRQDLSRVGDALKQQRRQELITQARECLKVLNDKETGIDGFNETVYGNIRSFAVEQGISQDVMDELVDPAALKIINMARLYMKAKKTVQTSKPDKKTAPKRIVRSSATATTTKKVISNKARDDAMKRLAVSGSVEDAADAFGARRGSPDDE